MASERLKREIQRRMDTLNLNALSTAKRAKLGDDAVRDILRGKSENPSHDTLSKIAKALGCNVADLTGERLAGRGRVAVESDPSVVAINELDVHVAAGTGTADEAGGLMLAHEHSAVTGVHTYPAASFREAYGMDPGKIKILPVRGTSMEPELWAGQRVMVDITDTIPSPPGVFVVWDGLGLVLKYVEVIANSDPVRVRISSAHQAFKPYERNQEEAYINGRVVGVWKRM